MKKLILAVTIVSMTALTAIVVVSHRTEHPSKAEGVASPAIATAAIANPSADAPRDDSPITENVVKPVDSVVAAPTSNAMPAPPAVSPSVVSGLSQPLRTLISPQASYTQKQAAWKELQDAHQLDGAITDLERATKADPSVAEYSAALGEAYVQKLRTIQDFREQSILAIKADQSFDQALELDPSNWDARFWKALSLSYWPDALNKSPEVIDNLVTLLEQQENRPPEPQFAQTYLLLGEQYLKVGYTDDAREAWRRGTLLFPDNSALREKFAELQ